MNHKILLLMVCDKKLKIVKVIIRASYTLIIVVLFTIINKYLNQTFPFVSAVYIPYATIKPLFPYRPYIILFSGFIL